MHTTSHNQTIYLTYSPPKSEPEVKTKKTYNKRQLQKPQTQEEYATNLLFFSTKDKAEKERKIEFSLCLEQYKELMFKNCTYCGSPPNNKRNLRFHGKCFTFLYSGLDRVDSTMGYHIENVVPCCKMCNLAKGCKTTTEFEAWIERFK